MENFTVEDVYNFIVYSSMIKGSTRRHANIMAVTLTWDLFIELNKRTFTDGCTSFVFADLKKYLKEVKNA